MHNRVYIYLLLLLTLISGLSGLAGNIASNALPEDVKPYAWLAWPVFIILMVLASLLVIWQAQIQQRASSPSKEVTSWTTNNDRKKQRLSKGEDHFEFDVFVSYSYKDRSWVNKEILPRLETQGLKVCIDYRDFIPGKPTIIEIERALQTSHKTILVLSTNYLKSSWAEFEQLLLQTVDPANLEGRLVPLLREKCNLPLRLGYLTYIDFSESEKREMAWGKLSEVLGRSSISKTWMELTPSVLSPRDRHEDWGECPDVNIFYGRKDELAQLTNWMIADNCRVIGIFGAGGMGKTALATKLAVETKKHFHKIFWRSLRDAPPLIRILSECIVFLSNQQIETPDDLNTAITLLIDQLKEQRCLLVLDNLETILEDQVTVGRYRQSYESYGTLIRRVAESTHQSCLMVTSRERSKEFAAFSGDSSPVRSLQLVGVGNIDGRNIIGNSSLTGSDEAWQLLVERYSGNPLALKLIADAINEVYAGEISHFLEQGTFIFGDVRDLVDQQFERLSGLEKEIVYWLAIEREPVSLYGLQSNIFVDRSREQIFDALTSLSRRSLIEKVLPGFTLQNVIMEFVTKQYIDRICQEILADKTDLLRSHTIVNAVAKDYVRESQIRVIVSPILEKLARILGKENVENNLEQSLRSAQSSSRVNQGYAGGNLINLFVQNLSSLNGRDFSGLAVWQAYLQGVNLQNANFTRCEFAQCIFTEAFGSILTVALSPNGESLAAGTADGRIGLWLALSGKHVLDLDGHKGRVWSLAFSSDGLTLVSGGEDNFVRVWDIETGNLLRILQGHTKPIWSVAYDSGSQTIASASEDCTVRVWNAKTGNCLATFDEHSRPVLSVAFSQDGQLLASASEDQTVRVWNIDTLQNTHILQGHTNWVWSVSFNQDGTRLASGSEDRTIRIWDLSTEQCIKTLEGHLNTVRSVTFSNDDLMLASAGEEPTIKIWDTETGQILRNLRGHSSWVRSVAFAASARTLASGSDDRSVRIWDVKTGECIRTLQAYTNWVLSLAFNPQTRSLASGSDDGVVRVWDFKTGHCNRKLEGHNNHIWGIAFSPNGQMLASCSDDRTIRMWNASTGECLKVLRGHSGRIWSVAFSPDNQLLVSSSSDLSVRIWDINTGQSLKILQGHTSPVRSVTFSPDGHVVASASEDHSVRIWDVESGKCVAVLQKHNSWVWCVAFSPDGRMLASGSEDRSIRTWDTSSYQCTNVLEGHTNQVWSVAFSPDSQTVASCSDDCTVRLWNVITGQTRAILQGHSRPVRTVTFDLDGLVIASGGQDEMIKIWDITSSECIRTLQIAKPYQYMKITEATGLSEGQKATLMLLGAIE